MNTRGLGMQTIDQTAQRYRGVRCSSATACDRSKAALSELNRRIQLDAEFPDAGYVVAWLFKVCHHDLADAYDAQFQGAHS